MKSHLHKRFHSTFHITPSYYCFDMRNELCYGPINVYSLPLYLKLIALFINIHIRFVYLSKKVLKNVIDFCGWSKVKFKWICKYLPYMKVPYKSLFVCVCVHSLICAARCKLGSSSLSARTSASATTTIIPPSPPTYSSPGMHNT